MSQWSCSLSGMSEHTFEGLWVSGDDQPFTDVGSAPESAYAFLVDLAPGPVLGSVLAGIDRTGLNGHDLVYLMRARLHQISHLQAELYRDMVELGHCPPSGPGDPPRRIDVFFEDTADEVRAALVWTRRAAETAVSDAWEMTLRYPAVGQALASGHIDLARARVIIQEVTGLDEATATNIIDTILAVASQLTTGQLRARLARLRIDTDPDAAADRYQQGHAQRRVLADPRPQGTTDLVGENLDPARVAAILARINQLARRHRSRTDPRTPDQLKADIFLELLEGQHHQTPGQRPRVDLRIDLDTLIGLNHRAGEIPGWGPVIADIARRAIHQDPDGEWRIQITDPDTGAILWNGTTRLRPTTTQRRHVQTRQPECTHPRCRMPAINSDLDHLQPRSQDGPTLTHNLAPACRHDHMLHTRGTWTIQPDSTGNYTWISPHSHRYTKPP